jgi:hypothetical protein
VLDRKDELEDHWLDLLHDYEAAHTPSITEKESAA